MFDADTFLHTQTTEADSTRREPIPVGEYTAVVEGIKPDVTQSGKPLLRVNWKLADPRYPDVEGRLVDQTIWLDVTDTGSLDRSKGKNIGLGRLRTAVGQNNPGQPWSPAMLMGQVALVSISHRADKDDPDVLYDQVKGVTKAV
jgi:hypothetical protein